MVKLKKGAGKWFLLALLSGSLTGAACLLLGAETIIANSLPMGVSAGVLFSFREKWQGRT